MGDSPTLTVTLSSAVLDGLTDDNVMILDAEGRIVHVNFTAPDLDPAAVIGNRPQDYVSPEHRQVIDDALAEVVATGRVVFYTTSYVTAEGRIAIWRSRVAPLHGESDGFVIVSHNVTDRLEPGVERERLFELSMDPLVVLGIDGFIRSYNPAFRTLLGIPDDRVGGARLLDLVHPDDRAGTRTALDRLQEEDHLDLETRMPSTSRPDRVVVWRFRADPQRGLIHAVARDETHRRQLEQRLLQSQKLQAVGQLAGGVAHDFNNLLTTVILNTELLTELLSERETDDTAMRRLREIGQAADRASDLTRQLLVFSRHQAARHDALSLSQVVREVSSILRRLIPENVEIEITADDGPHVVVGDRVHLEQVVMNLAINARDAMPNGGRLTLATSLVGPSPPFGEGPSVVLTVRDSGEGIAPEVSDRIFEPFFSTKDSEAHTGLGLATVYGIVQQHGGWIRVDSPPGDGTTFEVHLPARPRHALHRRETRPRVLAAPGGSETILVAEDERAVRDVVSALLRGAGYRVLGAADAVSAIDLCDGNDIDLVLLDVVMPGQHSAAETWERIRARCPSVIFTTGYRPSRRQKLPGPLLHKPYPPSDLLRLVRTTLDARR